MADNNSKNNNLSSYIKSTIKKQLKTDERADVLSNDINKNQKDEKNENSNKKLSFKQRWKVKQIEQQYKIEAINKKEILMRMLSGFAFGSGAVVYGTSASLNAYNTSNYESILNGWYDLFKPQNLKDFLWKLLWLLPFFIAFIATFAVFYAINSVAYVNGYSLALIFLFLAISISLAFFNFFANKTKTNNFFKLKNQPDKKNLKTLLIFLTSALSLFVIAFVARYAWLKEFPLSNLNYEQFLIVHFNNSTISSIISQSTIETKYALQILMATFFCGLVFFIPGISGSYIMAVLGSNSFINTAFRYAFGHYAPNGVTIDLSWAWSTIIISFIGVVLGFVTSIFVSRYLNNKHFEIWKIMILGFSTFLPLAILVSLQNVDYEIIGEQKELLAATMVLFFVPLLAGISTIAWIKREDIRNIIGFVK